MLWLSGSLRPFLYSSSVYSYHFFLISSVSVRSILFLSFIVPICMKCSLGIYNFLEEISNLSHSILLHDFSALITEEGFLISFFYSLDSAFKWVYLSFSPLPFTFLLFSAICKLSSDNHFALLHCFFLGMVLTLPPVQCHEPPSIVPQALYQI